MAFLRPDTPREEASHKDHATASERGVLRDPVIWLLVLSAFALRLIYNLALHSDDFTAGFVIDEREYFGAAHMLVEGRGFSFFDTALWVRPPLYVTLLAGVLRIGGDSYLPLLLLQALLGAVTLLPLGWLAWRIAGLRAARWCVGLAALYLPFTLFSGLLLSETLFTLLLSLTFISLLIALDRLEEGLRKSLPWLLLSGVLLGLSALTRSTALGFVPLVALYLIFAPGGGRRGSDTGSPDAEPEEENVKYAPRARESRRHLIAAFVVCVACLLTLVPWTVRNVAAYGKLILIDTTGGYNLWLASVGVKDEERLRADYTKIANQAERQSYAYARAWEEISADPLSFVGKGLKESLDLWMPNFSAEERQVKGYALGRVPAWHLLALFFLDDLLYILILVLSVVGLALTPRHPLKWLTGLWVLLWVVISFIFFAVTRFRLPVVAALLPWAGAGIAMIVSGRGRGATLRRLPRTSRIATVAVLLAILLVTLPTLPVSDTILGVGKWGEQEGYRQGELLLKAGDTTGALAAYARANQEITDTRYATAAAYLRTRDAVRALSFLKADEPGDRFEPAIIRGEAARIQGNLLSARSFFRAREVNVAADRALQWAWDHLSPPPTQEIVLGSGLDVGYIRGFYGAETAEDGTTFRWSGAHSEVRGGGAVSSLEVTWSGWRPGGVTPALPDILAGTLPNSLAWTSDKITLASPASSTLDLNVNAFIGAGNDPRLLGVRIARIGVER